MKLSRMTRNKIKGWLKEKLRISRYRHSLSVQEMAEELAEIYDADISKASLAGLVHDCAKWMSPQRLLFSAEYYNINLDILEQEHPSILHAIIGERLAADTFGITDEEILTAIKYHTTGHARMSLMDKILYVADFAEPLREYDEAKPVRKLAYVNLNIAALKAAEQKLRHLLRRGLVIHPNTVAARNEMILTLKNTKIKVGKHKARQSRHPESRKAGKPNTVI